MATRSNDDFRRLESLHIDYEHYKHPHIYNNTPDCPVMDVVNQIHPYFRPWCSAYDKWVTLAALEKRSQVQVRPNRPQILYRVWSKQEKSTRVQQHATGIHAIRVSPEQNE